MSALWSERERPRPITLLAKSNPHDWRSDEPVRDWWWWNRLLLCQIAIEIVGITIFLAAGYAFMAWIFGERP